MTTAVFAPLGTIRSLNDVHKEIVAIRRAVENMTAEKSTPINVEIMQGQLAMEGDDTARQLKALERKVRDLENSLAMLSGG